MTKRIEDEQSYSPLAERPEKDTNVGKQFALTFLLVALVTSRSVDVVLYVRLATKLQHYIWFLSQIVISIAFCCISWPIVLFRHHFFKSKRADSSSSMTQGNTQYSKLRMALMGLLDAIGTLMVTLAAPYLSGSVFVITSQFVIPSTMLFSFLILGTRYRWYHVVGAVVIFVGIVLDAVPRLSTDGHNEWFWVLLSLLGTLPQAVSNIMKEHALKTFELDVWWFNAWISTFQLLFSAVTWPTVFIPFPPPASTLAPSQFPSYVASSSKCLFFGIGTFSDDDCDYALLVFGLYLIFFCAFNILLLIIFQLESASLGMLASAGRIALSNLGFGIPFLAGDAKTQLLPTLSFIDISALIIICVGTILFRYRAAGESGAVTVPGSPAIGHFPYEGFDPHVHKMWHAECVSSMEKAGMHGLADGSVNAAGPRLSPLTASPIVTPSVNSFVPPMSPALPRNTLPEDDFEFRLSVV